MGGAFDDGDFSHAPNITDNGTAGNHLNVLKHGEIVKTCGPSRCFTVENVCENDAMAADAALGESAALAEGERLAKCSE